MKRDKMRHWRENQLPVKKYTDEYREEMRMGKAAIDGIEMLHVRGYIALIWFAMLCVLAVGAWFDTTVVWTLCMVAFAFLVVVYIRLKMTERRKYRNSERLGNTQEFERFQDRIQHEAVEKRRRDREIEERRRRGYEGFMDDIFGRRN